MRFTSKVLLVLLYAISVTVLPAQETSENNPSRLNLARIFSNGEFTSRGFGPARWLQHGTGYTCLQKTAGGQKIVRTDPRTGKESVLVSVADLTPRNSDRALKIEDYKWSENNRKMLVFTCSKRVWRDNTRGDFWVLDLKTRELHQLGGNAAPSSLMFAKFSPDSNRVAYVMEKNIYVEDLNSHQIIQLTRDGKGDIVNGTGDWVYEEELSMRDGFRWSPDGSHIAFWQFDSSKVKKFTLINNTRELYPVLTRFPYPKAGQTNSACRIGVVSAQGGPVTWIRVNGDPRQHYIARLKWGPAGRKVYFQRLNRKQNVNQVVAGDISTGASRVVFSDSDPAWVEVCDHMHWVSGGRYFTWISEKDGWRSAYLVDTRTGKCRRVGNFNFDIIRVCGISKNNRWLFFIASPDNPAQRYLYRVRLKTQAAAERLTPLTQAGTHHYQIDPTGRRAIHTFSCFGTPPKTDLVSLPGHKQLRMLEANSLLAKQVAGIRRGSHSFFRVKNSEGQLLDCFEMRPPDFDPLRKYPVLFYVYGEPWHQTVLDVWGRDTYLWHLYLTQQGYLVISVDNRGTPAPRGRAWRKSIYRKIGVISSADQADACREIICTRNYVDPGKIAVWGWSGGGSMTLNMLFRYPDLYGTGMAVAPVSDLRYYDSIYQERYMGLPGENEKDYLRGSPISFAKNLTGNLLIVHGTGDDNVHFQGTEKLINELVRHNRVFSMMAYPNRSHGIYEGKNTSRHLFELLTRFLLNHTRNCAEN